MLGIYFVGVKNTGIYFVGVKNTGIYFVGVGKYWDIFCRGKKILGYIL